LFQLAVTLEIQEKISSPDSGRAARRVLYLALAATLLVAAIPGIVDAAHQGGVKLETMLQSMMRFKTCLSTVLAVFLIDAAAVFAMTPTPHRGPPWSRHTWVMTLFLGLYAGASLTIVLTSGRLTVAVNRVFVPVLTVCFMLWLWILKPVSGATASH
jgi:hypothetical protein